MTERPHGHCTLHRGCVSVLVNLGPRLPSCLLSSSLAPAGSLNPACFFLELRKKDPKKLPKCVSQGFLRSVPCIRFSETFSSYASVDSRLFPCLSSALGFWHRMGSVPQSVASHCCIRIEHPKWVLLLTEVEPRYRPVWSAIKVLTAQPDTAGVGDLVTLSLI